VSVSRELQTPAHFSGRQAAAIRANIGGAVSSMLTQPTGVSDEALRETWQREHLRTGRFLTVGSHTVWVRPVVQDLTHIPAPPTGPEGPGPREYQVNFGGPARESGTAIVDSKGLEGVVEGTFNLGTGGHLSAVTPFAATFSSDSERTRSTTSSTQNVSGRKVMSGGATEFGAGLKFKVYVDGVEWESGRVFDDVVNLKFPDEFSGTMDNRPDVSTRVPNVALPDHRSPHARVMITAIDPAPFVAELQRQLLAAKVPADAVNNLIKKLMEEMLSETSIRNRERWWISSGDVSSKMRQGTSIVSAFHGDFTATAKIKRLENITDNAPTAKVRLRDDIGLAFAKARGRGNTSSAALNLMFDFGGMHAVASSRDDLGYLMAGASATSTRTHSSTLGSASMNKTTLMRDTVQERYRAEVEVTVSTSSSTHKVAPAVARTIAEIDVPQPEAAEFEKTVLGRVDTERLKATAPAAVQNQPNVQNLLRGAAELGVLPTLETRRPTELIDPSNWAPDPDEPLAVRSRRGQSFGMLLSLPGSERVYNDIVSVLHTKVAAGQGQVRSTARAAGLARGADWSQAHRDLSSHFGTPALEGDMQVLQSSIDHSLKIDGTRYDVSVLGLVGQKLDQQAYDLTVNARATGGDTVTSTRNRIKALKFFVAASARFKIKDFVKFEAGNFQVQGGRGWNRSTSLTSGAKTYRRTETVGEVNDNLYQMVYEVKVRTGGVGGEVETFYVYGDDVVARFAIPKQHRAAPAPAPAASTDQAAPATEQAAPTTGQTAPTTEQTESQQTQTPTLATPPPLIPQAQVYAPRPTSPALDFDNARTDGLYPVFATIPELAQQAGHLYQDLNGIPRSDERWDWPETIRSMATPTSLQNGFDASVGSRGWTERLPDFKGWKQAVKYELALYDTEHEKEHFEDKTVDAPDGSGTKVKLPGDGDVEIEWYQQSVGHVSQGKGSDTEATASVGVGPIFTPGKEDEGSGTGLTGQDGARRKAANQVSVNVSGGKSYKRQKLTTQKDGSIDVTRTTYSGSVHAYRSSPYFKITVMRWNKWGKEQSRSATVYAPQALEFIIPERRARDLNLPLPPEPPAQTQQTPPQTDQINQTAQTEQQTQPPPPATVIAMADSELAVSMSHPELLDADDVLEALIEKLREKGLLGQPTAAMPDGHPNDLMEYLQKRFNSRALQNEFVNLRRTGVVGWHPIPKKFGAGKHLWVRVTGTLDEVTSSAPRKDAKLTIRAEKFSETEKEQGTEHGTEALFHTQGYASVGDSRVGGGFEAGYSGSSEQSGRETSTTRDIFRIGTSDKSVEFTAGMRYKIEVGVSTEAPELARLAVQAAKKTMFEAADLLAKNDLGGQGMRELWYRKRPWHWFETITDRSNPLADRTVVYDGNAANDGVVPNDVADIAPRVPLTGSVRLLTPEHLTASAPQHTPIVAPSEGQIVEWIAKPEPATIAPSPMLSRATFDRLREKIHPNTVPATHAMTKWAGLTTVPEYRRNPDLTQHQATSVPGLGLDTLPGMQLAYLTSDTVTRADIVNLLDHNHQVPVRGKNVNIGLDIVSATRIQSTVFKARRYTQAETEPGAEEKRSGGFGYAFQFIGGRAIDDDVRIFESEPAYTGGRNKSTAAGAHAGEIDESDKEERVGYRYYAMDVDLVIDGPNGALRIRVPNGLYAMMPERDGVFMEQNAPDVFGASAREQANDASKQAEEDATQAPPKPQPRPTQRPSAGGAVTQSSGGPQTQMPQADDSAPATPNLAATPPLLGFGASLDASFDPTALTIDPMALTIDPSALMVPAASPVVAPAVHTPVAPPAVDPLTLAPAAVAPAADPNAPAPYVHKGPIYTDLPISTELAVLPGLYRASTRELLIDGFWYNAAALVDWVKQKFEWTDGDTRKVLLTSGGSNGVDQIARDMGNFATEVAAGLSTSVFLTRATLIEDEHGALQSGRLEFTPDGVPRLYNVQDDTIEEYDANGLVQVLDRDVEIAMASVGIPILRPALPPGHLTLRNYLTPLPAAAPAAQPSQPVAEPKPTPLTSPVGPVGITFGLPPTTSFTDGSPARFWQVRSTKRDLFKSAEAASWMPKAPWAKDPSPGRQPYLVHVPRGTRVTWAHLERTLLADQILAARPAADPIALLRPAAGDGDLATVRRFAESTGRTVFVFTRGTDLVDLGGSLQILVKADTKGIDGGWIRIEPPSSAAGGGYRKGDYPRGIVARDRREAEVMLPTIGGGYVRLGKIVSQTIVDGETLLPTGRSFHTTQDVLTRQEFIQALDPAVGTYKEHEPGDANAPHVERPAPTDPTKPIYVALAHGTAEAIDVPTDAGNAKLSAPAFGEVLRRRPSVSALPKDGQILALACSTAPLGDDLANAAGKLMITPTTIATVSAPDAQTKLSYGLLRDAQGNPGNWVQSVPGATPSEPLAFRDIKPRDMAAHVRTLPTSDDALFIAGSYDRDNGVVEIKGTAFNAVALGHQLMATQAWQQRPRPVVLFAGGAGGKYQSSVDMAEYAWTLAKTIGQKVVIARASLLQARDGSFRAGTAYFDEQGVLQTYARGDDVFEAYAPDGSFEELFEDFIPSMNQLGITVRPAAALPDMQTLWNYDVQIPLRAPMAAPAATASWQMREFHGTHVTSFAVDEWLDATDAQTRAQTQHWHALAALTFGPDPATAAFDPQELAALQMLERANARLAAADLAMNGGAGDGNGADVGNGADLGNVSGADLGNVSGADLGNASAGVDGTGVAGSDVLAAADPIDLMDPMDLAGMPDLTALIDWNAAPFGAAEPGQAGSAGPAQTQAPQTQSPLTRSPQVQSPQAGAAQTQAPRTQSPRTQLPRTQPASVPASGSTSNGNTESPLLVTTRPINALTGSPWYLNADQWARLDSLGLVPRDGASEGDVFELIYRQQPDLVRAALPQLSSPSDATDERSISAMHSLAAAYFADNADDYVPLDIPESRRPGLIDQIRQALAGPDAYSAPAGYEEVAAEVIADLFGFHVHLVDPYGVRFFGGREAPSAALVQATRADFGAAPDRYLIAEPAPVTAAAEPQSPSPAERVVSPADPDHG
jgi:hypothetical protein